MPAQTFAAETVRFRLQARPSSAALLRRKLHAWLDSIGASEREQFDVLLSASEAFANAVEHPRLPAAAVIDVQADVFDDVVELSIRDYGVWRDEREREEGGGLGFPIMRTLMHDVEVDTRCDGSTIRLRRRLGSLPG